MPGKESYLDQERHASCWGRSMEYVHGRWNQKGRGDNSMLCLEDLSQEEMWVTIKTERMLYIFEGNIELEVYGAQR